MTNQKKLARQWAESRAQFENRSERERAAAEFILANTPPETMADVVWDHNQHFGLACEGEDGVEWVMLLKRDDGRILGVTPDLQKIRGLLPRWLTPNGKRYKLVEDTTPDHPEVLETLEDYVNAPEGTIIARPGDIPWIKEGAMWRSPACNDSSHSLALYRNPPRVVLRWGKGKEA